MDGNHPVGATICLAALVVLAGCTTAIGDVTDGSSPTGTITKSDEPGDTPSVSGTDGETPAPTPDRTTSPTPSPTERPTASPTASPTAGPTASATPVQTDSPTGSPTADESTDRDRFLEALADRGIEARYLEDHPDDDGDDWVIAYDSTVDDGGSADWSAFAEEARAITHAYCAVIDGEQGQVMVWPTGHHSFQIDASLCWKWEQGTLDGGEVDVMAVVMGSMKPYPASMDPYSGRAE